MGPLPDFENYADPDHSRALLFPIVCHIANQYNALYSFLPAVLMEVFIISGIPADIVWSSCFHHFYLGMNRFPERRGLLDVSTKMLNFRSAAMSCLPGLDSDPYFPDGSYQLTF